MLHRREVLFLLAAAGVTGVPRPAHAQPSAEQVLTDLGLSASDRQRVLREEFVTADVAAASERDLSFAIAFLVKTSPAALGKRVLGGDLVTADAQVQAMGEIKGAGNPADFAGLKVSGKEAKSLAAVKAGDAFNFSAAEIAALAAVRGGAEAVLQQTRHKILLGRYQAYRTAGLAGIAPYDRGGGRTTDHAADLRRAGEASTGLKKYLPAFHAALLDYPKAAMPGMQERFFWVKSLIEGKTTYILSHMMGAADGAAYALVRRQYYANTNYNGGQLVAGFLPVATGTVAVITSHAFTDQVTGMGGSMKRSLGSSIMAKKMREIFEAGRRKVAS
jgi:hypothetical protein